MHYLNNGTKFGQLKYALNLHPWKIPNYLGVICIKIKDVKH